MQESETSHVPQEITQVQKWNPRAFGCVYKTSKHHHDSTCHMPCMTRTMVTGMLHSESKLHFAMTSMSILETQRALEAPDINAWDLLEIGTELSPALEEIYISSNC